MLDGPIIECVPNFSEGRNRQVIDAIAREIESVEGVYLLDVDMGWATNRTVVTFAGSPESVVEAAFRAIRAASELIDMREHRGAHPRMGATDVCPLVPVANITMEETVQWAVRLAERVGNELRIPVYLYEAAARTADRKSLAVIRAGEYEALKQKLSDPKWKPDFGPDKWDEHVARTGATVIGARPFLVAYNINLNTRSVRRANSVAFDLRERGRLLRKDHPLLGELVRDITGEAYRQPGWFRDVRGIGWYIDEYGFAQVSLNILNIDTCPVHLVFEKAEECARRRGLRVTGSEIVGLVPKKVLVEAGKYFLKKQRLSWGVPEEELIHIAVLSLGLSSVQPFDPRKKVIEYVLEEKAGKVPKGDRQSVRAWLNEVSMDTPVPGGGSVSALVGSLACALTAMVANLTANQRGREEEMQPEFAPLAERAQNLKDVLYRLVDEDAQAFEAVREAYRSKDAERVERALKGAVESPFRMLKTIVQLLDVLEAVAERGMESALSDVGVACHLAHACSEGAWLNILINCREIGDRAWVEGMLHEAGALRQLVEEKTRVLGQRIEKRLQRA